MVVILSRRSPARQALGLLLSLVIVLSGWIPAAAAWADTLPEARAYHCDGEPLLAELVPGAVDARDIPNTLAGTLPGAYLVLRWRGVQLQLPRTNNAGSPSFSDGKWAWSEADPGHPRLRLRRAGGDVQEFACAAED
jgi:hypothetical protein